MAYGFKKNAKVTLNISNLTTQIVFGLATKEEMENINSLGPCLQNCDGKMNLSQIQFLIKQDTNLNFTVPSKNVLTPFSISCSQVYKFKIELGILNGDNNLDYRYQNTLNFIISFFVILIIITLASLIIQFKKFKKKELISFLQILLFLIISIIQQIPLYMEYSSSKNDEFITLHNKYEIIIYFSSALNIFNLCIFNIFNDSIYYLNSKFNNIWSWSIPSLVIIILICILLFINLTVCNYVTFFVCSLFYIIVLICFAATPSIFSLTKLAIMIYMIASYFTFAGRSSFFFFARNICSEGVSLMYLGVISVMSIFVSSILMLVDHFYSYKLIFDVKSLEEQKSDELTKNYSVIEQRSDFINDIQDEIYQDDQE